MSANVFAVNVIASIAARRREIDNRKFRNRMRDKLAVFKGPMAALPDDPPF
jgi:hypothetical protein